MAVGAMWVTLQRSQNFDQALASVSTNVSFSFPERYEAKGEQCRAPPWQEAVSEEWKRRPEN